MPVHSREKKENNHDEMEVDYGENEGSTSEEEETESSSVSEEGDSSGTGVAVSAVLSAPSGGNRPPAPAAALPLPAPAATPPRGPPVAAAQPGAGTWRGHDDTSSVPAAGPGAVRAGPRGAALSVWGLDGASVRGRSQRPPVSSQAKPSISVGCFGACLGGRGPVSAIDLFCAALNPALLKAPSFYA